ncbi:MAG: FKBP-type peptidyl-prolyl cis-trans isomerase [Candidatus Dojkabacteria bacterium]|nr:FKBP-type peptidyl-prolyl cis-trans isomerase [Candidatus Dojkabacteria bacterium]
MKNQSMIFLGIALFILVVLASLAIFLLGDTGDGNTTLSLNKLTQGDTESNLNEDTDMPTVQDFEELQIKVIKEGEGEASVEGDIVSVNYEGTLIDGTKFDSSYDRGTPFEFTLGAGEVIVGWEEGVKGMKVGEIRELSIPSSKGYGTAGAGSLIPPSAGLIFKVELLEIK